MTSARAVPDAGSHSIGDMRIDLESLLERFQAAKIACDFRMGRTDPDAAQSPSGRSDLPLDHLQLQPGDRLRRIETLGARLGAVHDGVAAIEAERVFEIV